MYCKVGYRVCHNGETLSRSKMCGSDLGAIDWPGPCHFKCLPDVLFSESFLKWAFDLLKKLSL